MADSLSAALLVVAIIANGLLAGLFFVFGVAVSPGFRAVDDATYVRAFRAINSAIVNPWFLAVFFVGPGAVAYVVNSMLHGWQTALLSAIAGAACSVLTFAITVAGNVPLNRLLDGAPVATASEQTAARRRFEAPWNRWNAARVATSTGALVLLTATLAIS